MALQFWLPLGALSLALLAACASDDSGGESSAGGTVAGGGGVSAAGSPFASAAGRLGEVPDGAGGTGAAESGGGGDEPVAGTTSDVSGGGDDALTSAAGASAGGGTGPPPAGGAGSGGTSGPPTGGAGSGGNADTGGTTASAGAASDVETTCGTASEEGSLSLACPEGEVIDSVLFASYGNPTGECGGFVAGDCHSESSAATVTSRCVGRSSCAVVATNASFGDPCSGGAKALAVEVTCVAGEPAVAASPFKGLANSPASEIATLGASWCYNWMTSPQATDCDDPLFVPMVWGSEDVAGAMEQIGDAGYTTALGFNEPNKGAPQSDMTVDEAIALWPAMTSNPDIRVGSPAVSDDGRAWLEGFMERAQAQGLRVDFIAMHWYGWNEGSCTAGALEGAIRWAEQWGLPVWITEFGCMGSSNPDEQTLLDFLPAAVAMIENHPLVERYAWYPWNDYNHVFLEDSSGASVITPLGELFLAAPAYR